MKRSLHVMLLGLALAGCSRSEPEEAQGSNAAKDQPAPPPMEVQPSPTASLSPTPTPTTDANSTDVELPPAEELGANEQVLDDASATGMTARARRDEGETTEPPPANSEGR